MGRAERRNGRSEEEDESVTLRMKRSSRRKTKSPTKGGSSGKRKKPTLAKRSVFSVTRYLPGLLDLASDFRVDPAGTSKRVCRKLVLYIWFIAVLIAVLSLLGFDVNPFAGSGGALAPADAGVIDNMVPGFLRGQAAHVSSADVSGGGSGGDDEDDDGGEPAAEGASDDDVPMQAFEAKKPVKLNKAKEKELACKMEDCIISCNKKITAKCAAKKSCKADREKICRKRCMKARCEERCKDEPHYGYVEREQKMDKCKEGCQGSTAQHNKCIKACHAAFQPCKSRCHQVSNRYKCDRVDDSAPPPPPDDMDDDPGMDSEPASSASSSFADEEDDDPAPASSAGRPAFDDFDDEVI